MEQNWTLISHHTQKSKWNNDTNMTFYVFNSYTVKLLEENIEKLLDIDLLVLKRPVTLWVLSKCFYI